LMTLIKVENYFINLLVTETYDKDFHLTCSVLLY